MVPTQPQRCAALWFEDATFIFQAESTLFRVYGGMLCARSSVFADILSIEQPADRDLMDGCSFVHLPDSAEDVECFFQAIFNSNFFMPPPSKVETRVICAVLGMSHKYDIPYLIQRAMLHLEPEFPTRLLGRLIVRMDSSPSTLEECLAIVQIASRTDVKWILPFVYYSICVYPIEDIVNSEGWRQLSIADQNRIIIGYPAQVLATAEILKFLRSAPSEPPCTTPNICNVARPLWDAWAHERWTHPSIRRVSDPLSQEHWFGSDWAGFKTQLCPNCFSAAKEKHNQARQTVWERLPAMFQLPAWNELERQRKILFSA